MTSYHPTRLYSSIHVVKVALRLTSFLSPFQGVPGDPGDNGTSGELGPPVRQQA